MRRNIQALVDHHTRQEKAKTWQLRLADTVTAFTGSLLFVAIHLVVFGGWTIFNLPFTPLPRFDPSFVLLATIASVEAIFLSTFVLISQNRMAAMQNIRADLDLQISLLVEHEITQLVTLVRRMALQMKIEEAQDPKLPELEHDVPPEEVLATLDQIRPNGGILPASASL